MWTTKLIQILSSITLFPLQLIYNHRTEDKLGSDSINFFYLLLVRTFAYLVDFLNMMSLLYLFYCQGKASMSDSRS